MTPRRTVLAALLTFAATGSDAASSGGVPPKEPAIAPPPPVAEEAPASVAADDAPATSATLAFSTHGDPTAEEQLFLELMNRARADPDAEADRVFRDYDDPLVTGPVDYFLALRPGVEWTRPENRNAFASYARRPPLVFDARLIDVARAHTQRMYDERDQSHQFPGEPGIGARITASGYSWSRVAENVFAYAASVLMAHAAFAIDYGQAVQTVSGDAFEPLGRPLLGHRRALMGFDGSSAYVHVGVGILSDERVGSGVGPRLVTVDFATPSPSARYVTGVCFEDRDGDDFYDVGEGLAGLRIESPDAGTATETSSSGGYALPVPAGLRTVAVVAIGEPGGPSELVGRVEQVVVVESTSVKLDFRPGGHAPPPAFERFVAPGPVTLTDGGETAATVAVVAPDPRVATLSDLEVEVSLTHADASELTLSIESPTGTRAVLFDRGLPVADLSGTFGRSLVSEEPLAAFVGEAFEGTWTLRVEDAAGGATGALAGWALRVRPAWPRPVHFGDTPLRLSRVVARGAGVPGAGSLVVSGAFDAPVASSPDAPPMLLRLRRTDGARDEIARFDASALAAAGQGVVRVRPGLRGTSRGSFRVALRDLGLPALPDAVTVEVSVAGALLAQTVPLPAGKFDARRSTAAAPRLSVSSVTSTRTAAGRATTVRGVFLDPSTDPRELVEVSVGTARGSLSAGALRTRGRRSSARTSTSLRHLSYDSRTGAFSFRVVGPHEAVEDGATRVSLRVGPAYGDAEVRPALAGNSVRY